MRISFKTTLPFLSVFLALANALDVSPKGIDFIAKFEGFRANCYLDSARLWTIGYGHLCGKAKCSNIPGPLTVVAAKEILRQDLDKAIQCVRTLLNLNQA